MGGYSVAHAMMMMIPEAWEQHTLMDDNRRAFYEFHAAMMEPWDGPAAIAFTDGRQIGATLDRNGLRPARYLITDDDLVVMASEAGVLPIPESRIVKKWRLQPGKMFLIDTEAGRIIDDTELKNALANAKPYKEWISRIRVKLDELQEAVHKPTAAATAAVENANSASLLDRQQAFGYTQEDLRMLMAPMATAGEEATGSMGNDSPLAVTSDKRQAALQLLPATVRAGHEPADRPDPRTARDVARLVRRTETEPARRQQHQPADATRGLAADCSTSSTWPSCATSNGTRPTSSRATNSTSAIPSRGVPKASRRASRRCAPRPSMRSRAASTS